MSVVLLCAVFAALAFLFALSDSALMASATTSADSLTPRSERTHRALAFARVLAQLGTGAALVVALDLADGDVSAHDILMLTLVGAAIVAVTEAAARELGDALGARAFGPLRPVCRLAEIALAPVVAIGARLDDALLRALPPAEASDARREEAAEQFRQVVASEAEVTTEEEEILQGVFALGDTQVNEIMVPRVDVVGVERETPWSEVVDRVRSSEHSRLPVYEETIDEIVGVLYAKDLLLPIITGEPPEGGWATLIRPASFIPTTKRVDDQLRDFRASGNHMAVVVDEYGGTAGIVTIEDVLEEIVGEIRDEHDDEEQPIESEEGRRFWVSGRVTLDELSDAIGRDLRHDDVSTVGGLIYELLGRVPRAGERLEVEGFRVVVERVVRRRVLRVYFERLATEPDETAGAGTDAEDAS